MKNLLATLLLLLCLMGSVFAQNADSGNKASGGQNTFREGDKIVNIGFGLGSSLYAGSHYTSKTPPISASFELGMKDNLFDEKSSLGIGGYLGYTGAKWEESGFGWKYKSIVVGVRGAVHYQLVDKLDTYSGLMLGYNIVSSSSFGTTWGASASAGGGIAYNWFIGGRYYFSDKIAGMVELGYGVAILNLGVAIKL